MTFLSALLRKFSACTHNVKVYAVHYDALTPTSQELRRTFCASMQIALVWSLFETGSASVRSGAVLSAYIYLCTNRNSTVGYVQGVTGIAQVKIPPHLPALASLVAKTLC